MTRCWNSVSLASRSFEVDRAPVDAAVLVAPVGKRFGGVEHLLIEAGPAGEAGVGEGRDLDRLRGDAGVGAGREGLALGRRLAQHAEVAEGAVVEAQLGRLRLAFGCRFAGGFGGFGLSVRFLRRVFAVAATRGDEQDQHRHDREPAQTPHISP